MYRPLNKLGTGDRPEVLARAETLFQEQLYELGAATDRRFALLSVLEWFASTAAALFISPLTWNGASSRVHPHVWMALGLGGVIASLPIVLGRLQAGRVATRHVIAASQMLMAGLLVHMTGGRIETHFAYFGLLAFLSFYRDWHVLVTATAVAGADHLLRALLWPESMYGATAVALWRPLEHAGWVFFEVAFLIDFVLQNRRSIHVMALGQARTEGVGDSVAEQVRLRTRELEESENRYRVIFEDSPLPMWIVDDQTLLFQAVNREAERTYGYSEAEMLGMHSFQIRPEEDLEEFKRHIATTTYSGTVLREWRHKKKDGTVFAVEVAAHLVELEGRRMVLVLANDISKRKRAEHERDAMELQLRHAQKLESIGQLAAGIAHEINTPAQYVGDNLHFLRDSFGEMQSLIALSGSLIPRLEVHEQFRPMAEEIRSALEEADIPYLVEEVPKALEQALDGVSRVSTLVKAMKDFSHPGQAAKIPADLNRAIESTIVVARNEWKYVANLETVFDPELPLVPCLVSDFNQVVLNLIVNAAHAITDVNQNGDKGIITVRTQRAGDFVEVRIQDTGGGIPAVVRDRIFDPFFTTKEVGKGTGQGLAIARSVIVDKHGGTIDFETTLGQGTTFVIRLPLRTAAAVPGDSLSESEVLVG